MSLFLLSCFGRKHVDKQKSNSYYLQNGKFFYIQNGNRLSSGIKQLYPVTGPLMVLDESLAADDETVFYKSYPQRHIDRRSFVIRDLVKKDKKHVYSLAYSGLPVVPDADPMTFKYMIVDSVNYATWGYDQSHYFAGHKIIEVDYDSFQVMNLMIAYDKNYVYLRTGSKISKMSRITGTARKLSLHFCADNANLYYYSFQKGFQTAKISDAAKLTLIDDRTITDGDIVISIDR
jgi:hypothetical protein